MTPACVVPPTAVRPTTDAGRCQPCHPPSVKWSLCVLAIAVAAALGPPADAAGPPSQAVIGSPPPPVPPSLIGGEWSHLPTSLPVVALTFDGGSGAQGANSVITALIAQRVPGTFFLTGRWIEGHPGLSSRIAARWWIGNHSYDHPHMTTLGAIAINNQVWRTQRLIRGLGREPRPMFRFPYGDRDARTIGIINQLGYGSIGWTVDTLGWKGRSAGITVDSIVRRVVAAARPGEIVLMHLGAAPDGSTLDAHALPRMITALRAKGYAFAGIRRFTLPK
jgi:peptidoglycan-N-acetylglucosamine deacetylase